MMRQLPRSWQTSHFAFFFFLLFLSFSLLVFNQRTLQGILNGP